MEAGEPMTCHGTVRNGVVVLPEDVRIPDGATVRVEIVSEASDGPAGGNGSELFRAAERAKSTGIRDLALNHDHYLYGLAKVSGG
jgi:hypothetical protein